MLLLLAKVLPLPLPNNIYPSRPSCPYTDADEPEPEAEAEAEAELSYDDDDDDEELIKSLISDVPIAARALFTSLPLAFFFVSNLLDIF